MRNRRKDARAAKSLAGWLEPRPSFDISLWAALALAALIEKPCGLQRPRLLDVDDQGATARDLDIGRALTGACCIQDENDDVL
jgi:hypothetical protein